MTSRSTRMNFRPHAGLLIAASVAALAFAWLLFGRDSGSVASSPTTLGLSNALGQGQHDPSAGGGAHIAKTTKSPVETSKVFASRDPFEPLVDIGGTDEAVDRPGERFSTGADEGKGDTRSTPFSESADGTNEGTSVRVVDVGDDATVDVDVEGRVFRVTKGDRFARNFKLLYVEAKCASMLFGDDQFTICEGERVSK
jgi:hypothetical protein